MAVVDLEPSDLARRCKITFSETQDDFDLLLGAVIETPSGKHFSLVRHLRSQSPGTEVWTAVDSPDLDADLEEVLEALGLGAGDVTWTAPEVRSFER